MGKCLAAGSKVSEKGKLMEEVAPPTRMNHEDLGRLRQAAHRVTLLYPGPVGALVSREINDWVDFGYVLANDGLIMRAVENILGTKLPGE